MWVGTPACVFILKALQLIVMCSRGWRQLGSTKPSGYDCISQRLTAWWLPQLCVPINFIFGSILMRHRTAGFLPLLRWPHLIYRKTVGKEPVYHLRMMPSVSHLQNYLYLHWLLPHGLPPQRRWYISSYPGKDISSFLSPRPFMSLSVSSNWPIPHRLRWTFVLAYKPLRS